MDQIKHSKLNVGAAEALDAIPVDIWVGTIAEHLETCEIVGLRAVSKDWRSIGSDENLWLNKLTHLTLQFPVLSDLDTGPEETAHEWYKRCHADGLRLDCALCTVRVLLEAQYILATINM